MTLDIELKLLAGLPLSFNDIKIYPISLRQIAQLGFEKFNIYLMYLTADPKMFGLDIKDENVTTFDILISNLIYGEDEIKEIIINAMELFLMTDVQFIIELNSFIIGLNAFLINNDADIPKLITRDGYPEFVKHLKLNNCLKNDTKPIEEFNPVNAKAEEIRQKILKGRQKFETNNNELTLFDLISVLSANSNNLNIINIWDITLFQFNDQFSRMQMIEEYEINIRSLMAGAKSSDVKLKHYLRKIDSKSENNEEPEDENVEKQQDAIFKINTVQQLDN